jgi:TPR repeat protein
MNFLKNQIKLIRLRSSSLKKTFMYTILAQIITHAFGFSAIATREEGIRFYEEGNYSAAKHHFWQSRYQNPEESAIYLAAMGVRTENHVADIENKHVLHLANIMQSLRNKTEDTKQLLQQLEVNAAEGDRHALFLIGTLSLSGKYMPKDYNKARKSLERAAGQGHIEALFKLGYMDLKKIGYSSDEGRGRDLMYRAAGQGSPLAMYNIGTYLRQGSHGYSMDKAEGIKWFQKATASGSKDAAYNLGIIEAKENKNYNEGVRYFMEAIRLGDGASVKAIERILSLKAREIDSYLMLEALKLRSLDITLRESLAWDYTFERLTSVEVKSKNLLWRYAERCGGVGKREEWVRRLQRYGGGESIPFMVRYGANHEEEIPALLQGVDKKYQGQLAFAFALQGMFTSEVGSSLLNHMREMNQDERLDLIDQFRSSPMWSQVPEGEFKDRVTNYYRTITDPASLLAPAYQEDGRRFWSMVQGSSLENVGRAILRVLRHIKEADPIGPLLFKELFSSKLESLENLLQCFSSLARPVKILKPTFIPQDLTLADIMISDPRIKVLNAHLFQNEQVDERDYEEAIRLLLGEFERLRGIKKITDEMCFGGDGGAMGDLIDLVRREFQQRRIPFANENQMMELFWEQQEDIRNMIFRLNPGHLGGKEQLEMLLRNIGGRQLEDPRERERGQRSFKGRVIKIAPMIMRLDEETRAAQLASWSVAGFNCSTRAKQEINGFYTRQQEAAGRADENTLETIIAKLLAGKRRDILRQHISNDVHIQLLIEKDFHEKFGLFGSQQDEQDDYEYMFRAYLPSPQLIEGKFKQNYTEQALIDLVLSKAEEGSFYTALSSRLDEYQGRPNAASLEDLFDPDTYKLTSEGAKAILYSFGYFEGQGMDISQQAIEDIEEESL